MKRKFAVLTVLGALVALAVPASSMGSMFPATHKFEIAGGALNLMTPLGSCPILKVTGQIPAAPANEEGTQVPVTVTPGTCTSGTSLTLSGEWKFGVGAGSFVTTMHGSGAETLTLRFSSLPGCKLGGTGVMSGAWSNGVTSPSLLKSSYHAHSAQPLTWKNDGGTCALAGKTESVAWGIPGTGLGLNAVNNLTSPTTPITVGPNK